MSILSGLTLLLYCYAHVILPFCSVLAHFQHLIYIKPTPSPQDKIFSPLNIQLHFTSIYYLDLQQPASGTLYSNWLKGSELWLKARSLLHHFGLGRRVN